VQFLKTFIAAIDGGVVTKVTRTAKMQTPNFLYFNGIPQLQIGCYFLVPGETFASLRK